MNLVRFPLLLVMMSVVVFALPPEDGLILHTQLYRDFNDQSGNGHNGAGKSNPTFTEDQWGNAENALFLDHTKHQYVKIEGLGVHPERVFTFGVWIFMSSETLNRDDKYTVFMDYYNFAFAVIVDAENSNTLRTYHRYSTTQNHISTSSRTSGGRIPADAWTHVTVLFDGTRFSHYLNGVKQSVFGAEPTWSLAYEKDTDQTLPTYLGGFGSAFTFGDKLDDVRMYNRVLSDDEIMSLVTAVSTPAPVTPIPPTPWPDTAAPGFGHDKLIGVLFVVVVVVVVSSNQSY